MVSSTEARSCGGGRVPSAVKGVSVVSRGELYLQSGENFKTMPTFTSTSPTLPHTVLVVQMRTYIQATSHESP